MRPGMQCLLDLLRGRGFDRTIDEAEWDAALTLAEEEHILPWALSCLRCQHIPITSRTRDRLETIERDASIAAFYWSSELKSVLRAFDRSSLRVVLLKGPSLAERLYGNTALRASRDLDLLISKADFAHEQKLSSPRSDSFQVRPTTIIALGIEAPQRLNFTTMLRIHGLSTSTWRTPCDGHGQ